MQAGSIAEPSSSGPPVDGTSDSGDGILWRFALTTWEHDLGSVEITRELGEPFAISLDQADAFIDALSNYVERCRAAADG
jgi:hypothetical protein